MTYSQLQPKDGETVLICKHFQNGGTYHWFKCPVPIHFKRPDKTIGIGDWLCVCEDCRDAMLLDNVKPEIIGDKIYEGEEKGPFIKRHSQALSE